MRCWSRQLTDGAPEPLEMHHSSVLEAATSVINVVHETLLIEHIAPLEQVTFLFRLRFLKYSTRTRIWVHSTIVYTVCILVVCFRIKYC